MEEQNQEQKVVKEKDGNFLLGVILSLIGGTIASIPWVLVYVYGNMIYSVLAIIIALGAFYGYKISKAKIDKKVPVIIAIESIICVTVATLVVIPILLVAKEGLGISTESLKYLYSNEEFKAAIIQDYIVSFVFTILGISGIIANLNRQIKNGVDSKEIKVMANEPEVSEEAIQKIKETFVKFNAMDEMHTITKKEVLNEIEVNDKELMFNYLQNRGIIKKKKGKFYFSEEAEQNPKKAKNKSAITSIIAVIIVIAIVMGIGIAVNQNDSNGAKSNQTIQLSGSDIKIKLPNGFKELTEEEIDKMYGQGASQYYEFMASNISGSKSVVSFVINKKELKKEAQDAKGYIELVFEKEKDKTEISTKNISGYDFTTAKYEYKYQEKEYVEEYLVYENEEKYVCLDFIYPKDDVINIEKIIK